MQAVATVGDRRHQRLTALRLHLTTLDPIRDSVVGSTNPKVAGPNAGIAGIPDRFCELV